MKKVVPFIALAAQMASVKRTTGYKDGHFENDAEHSYQLSLVCWAANKLYALGLRDELILKLALAHDLVEVYAGDTDAHDSPADIASKVERERVAIEKLRSEYGEFKDLLEMIELYEKRIEPEAQLVYIMDKLVPDINIYTSGGDYYRSRRITFGKWREWVFSKIDATSLDPRLKPLLEESMAEIENNFDSFFKDATV